MNNAGVADPMDALPYLIMIFLQTIFYMIKSCIPLFIALNIESQKNQIVYKKNTNYKPVRKTRLKTTKPKPKQISRPVKKIEAVPQTSDDIIINCISALVKLGFKKGDAQKMIKKTCKTRSYRDESDLLKDAFKCVL